MPIIDLQRRLQECGRIRIGQQVPSGEGTRPARLETFRLTSADRVRIENAARLYGGKVEAWKAPAGDQWQVITDTDRLPIIVPPAAMAFSQWLELWSGGGCLRRCDGANEHISEQPCICAAEESERQCDYHTRLSVMLRDMTGLGLWRLDSQGYYAAIEIAGAVDIISTAAQRGDMLPAVLRLEQRVIKRPGETTRRFPVPVVDIQATPAQLLGHNGQEPAALEATPPPERPNVTPIPPEKPPWPTESIAQQAATPNKPKKRASRRAQPIPATGVKPRTRAQAHTDRTQNPVTVTAHTGADEPETRLRPAQLSKIQAQFRDLGYGGEEHSDDRHTIISHILGYPCTDTGSLTPNEAGTVIDTQIAWYFDNEPPIQDRINEILNAAALREAREAHEAEIADLEKRAQETPPDDQETLM